MSNSSAPNIGKRIKPGSSQVERRQAREALITVDYVHEILDHDPNTGVLLWRHRADASVQWNGRYAGKRAGRLTRNGYREISINGHQYYEHRLAHLWMLGVWPAAQMDHRLPNTRADNRWRNLRPATRGQNGANRKLGSNNTSGFKGVSWDRREQKWVAYVGAHAKQRHLGHFTDREQAGVAYAKAARATFGEFARPDHAAPRSND
jgi:hypothetical protein